MDAVISRFHKSASEAYTLATSYTLDEVNFLPLPRALPHTVRARLFQFFLEYGIDRANVVAIVTARLGDVDENENVDELVIRRAVLMALEQDAREWLTSDLLAHGIPDDLARNVAEMFTREAYTMFPHAGITFPHPGDPDQA